MRKLVVLVASLGLMIAAFYPTLAQDSGSIPKFVGVDIYNRAQAAYQAKQYQEAISDYSVVILLNPTLNLPYLQRAISYLQLKNTDAALVDLNHLIKFAPVDPALKSAAYMFRAEISHDANDMPGAIADYSASIRLAPDQAQAYYERGQIYMAQAEFDKALKDMTQAASIQPDLPNVAYFLGVLNYQAKDYAASIQSFSTYIKSTTNNYQAYAGRANAYIQQQQYDQALPDLNQALQIEPRDAGLYLQRGMVQQKLGDQAASAMDYLQWIRANYKEQKTDLILRPGESQVVPMSAGMVYIMSFDGQAGQKITISTSTQPNEQIDSLLILADTQSKPLTGDDDSGGNMNASIKDFILPTTGNYAVILSHAGGNPQGPVRILLSIDN